ncbi:MAG: hypothetical protein Q9213_003614 [Squamulea squamosa]
MHQRVTLRQKSMIEQRKSNIRLRSAWEADENYDFNRFHVPGCKRDKCDGKCGLESKKELWAQIRLRKEKEKQRRAIDAETEEAKKFKSTEKEDVQRRDSTTTATLSTIVDVEEPGDTDFVTGTKIRSRAVGNITPKRGRKKGVTFADQGAKVLDQQ